MARRIDHGHDLTIYEGLNWKERSALIKKQFPSTVNLDFVQVFREDPTVLGSIINDMMRIDLKQGGKPGRRSSATEEEATEYYARYSNDSYTILPFDEILNVLKGERSVRHMATKCGMHYSRVFTLLKGRDEPTVDEMVQIAKAFGKKPSFFVEYRIAYITGMIAERLRYAPESSVVQYNKLVGETEANL